MLGRAITTYGDTGTPNAAFGQLVNVGSATKALPALANIDPPRMFQLQVAGAVPVLIICGPGVFRPRAAAGII